MGSGLDGSSFPIPSAILFCHEPEAVSHGASRPMGQLLASTIPGLWITKSLCWNAVGLETLESPAGGKLSQRILIGRGSEPAESGRSSRSRVPFLVDVNPRRLAERHITKPPNTRKEHTHCYTYSQAWQHGP